MSIGLNYYLNLSYACVSEYDMWLIFAVAKSVDLNLNNIPYTMYESSTSLSKVP
jgi:hypothetical protein